MPGTIQILFNNFFEEGNPEMKPWIKRTLFGLFGVSLLVGGLTACGHRHGSPCWVTSCTSSASR